MNESVIDNWTVKISERYASEILPSGTLTYLFTDIEGSTHLWDEYPDQMRAAMARHDALVETAVIQQAGILVRPRGEGDSRFAVFPRASDALRAAIAIQRSLLAEPWQIPALRVRAALHSGEADMRDGDYYGSTVNRCARLRNASHGGQILLSETTYNLVRDELPAGMSLRDLGEYHLKGLERPEHIFQPIVTGLPAQFPPLNTPDRIRNNLPLSLTSFIGHERDLDELEHLLSRSRLLTITGTGGAGKTRLAIQLSQNVQGSFPDGVWFIDLAPLSNTSLLSQQVMNTLGMREEAGFTPYQTLMDKLRAKVLLLIFDNCEHLLHEMAHLVEDMLLNAPGVRILATSRERLGACGEVTWRIPSLSSPNVKETTDIERLLQYEAVRLFQDRAVAARPEFTITRENAGAVAKICSRLDGLPLAIELAAARVRVLSVDEIEKRLDDRFRLLVGSPTALPRQQTLRALINWSYDLLTEQERVLLLRLSVFSGGWTLASAEQVCGGGEIEEWEVLDLLTSLIDKSFVVCELRNGHERYRFLETIQKFSQTRLLERNETKEYTQKHADYFLKMTMSSYGKEWGPEQALWLRWLDEESDNLRAALEWFAQGAGNELFLLQLAGSLWRYWEIRGSFTEGRSWLETALEKSEDSPEYWHANGSSGAGHLARQQGDYMRAKTLHEQSLAIFRGIGCQLGTARQLNALGEIARFQGDYSRAVALHEESLSISTEIANKEGIAVSLRQLGVIGRDRGQYQYAKELLEESLKLERELGDKLFLAQSLNDLGIVAHHRCEYEQASSLFAEAMSIQREFDDRPGIANALQNLGTVAKDQGDFQQAELLCQQSLSLTKELGDKRGVSRTIAVLAEVAFLQGKYPLAADLAGQSYTLSVELGTKRGILNSQEILGFAAYYQGNYEKAAAFAEKSLTLSMEMDAPQAVGYAKILLALGKYAEGSLVEASDLFQNALVIFEKIDDYRNIAITHVNQARIAYRLGDFGEARQYLEKSLSISQDLRIRWTMGFVLEILGLLQRSEGNYESALELFQESLRLAVEQENQQGIANCLGALAGMAVMANQARLAARLFASAARLRREMGAKMSSKDQGEYENYLSMVHKNLDYADFEAEWSEGFTMTIGQIIEDLKKWSGDYPVLDVTVALARRNVR